MESELVDANVFMPYILWTGYFMKQQGYESLKSVMDQDNKSEILLEQNDIFQAAKGQNTSTSDIILLNT